MPWKAATNMEERSRFIDEAKYGGQSIKQLCQVYGISRQTGYKWLRREMLEGLEGLEDRSRRPKHSPVKSSNETEAKVLKIRDEHSAWGGRKIRRIFQNQGYSEIPSASTITEILRRNGRIDAVEALNHKAFIRFVHQSPNGLWQMDYKGAFRLLDGQSCHPLTVIDDHSRFLVGLKACPNERGLTVQKQLTLIFEQYGLPDRMLMDNGSPWGDDLESPYTFLTTWLMQLDVRVSHGRAYHPQTQGKNERLNRTLLEEVISYCAIADLAESQTVFDAWREVYNTIRPHDALELDTPASHYRPSLRPFPSSLPSVQYEKQDVVRRTDGSGVFFFEGRKFRVGKAFKQKSIALKPTDVDGKFDVYFCKQRIAQIDLRKDNS